MSIEAKIRAALTPIVPIVELHRYDGPEKTYIIWNFDEFGALHAGDKAQEARYYLTVSLHLPLRPTAPGESTSPRLLKRQIKAALESAGCTTPDITDASDEEGQLYVFNCEAVDDGDP